jgi:dTDP-4-dehydrorhamnose reductase
LRIFITGHKGQLGTTLAARLAEHDIVTGHPETAWLAEHQLPTSEIDITHTEAILQAIQDAQPDLVIHCAALTNVDRCAREPDEALRINGVGTHNVALACQRAGAAMLYVSTNEVFDGRATSPYREFDQPNPINSYGYSKYVGEQVTQRLLQRFYIVRTAWLYAPGGVNFIHRIIEQAQAYRRVERGPLRVVADEIGSPTYVVDLADAIARLIETGRYGVYHFVNEGECSRHAFAQEILRLVGMGDVPVEPISLADFERDSTPPPHTPLANFFGAAAGIRLRDWASALAAYIEAHIQSAQEPPE